MKGETKVTTTAEIKRLMDKAKLQMKEALERRNRSTQATVADSLSSEPPDEPDRRKRTIPAGGKAIESSSITSLLCWITM